MATTKLTKNIEQRDHTLEMAKFRHDDEHLRPTGTKSDYPDFVKMRDEILGCQEPDKEGPNLPADHEPYNGSEFDR